jgi:2,3-dihydroxybiphenyl 1,2-dioxygenase
MLVKALGYVGVTATDVAAWRDYATRVLAMEMVPLPGDALALRMDEKWGRIFVAPGAQNGLASLGLEVADAAALDEAVRRMRAAGHPVRVATEEERNQRRVAGLAIGRDPAGNTLELHHGLAEVVTRFHPPHPTAGFRTGALGMGHMVLAVTDHDAVLPLYRDVLGFKLTDYFVEPFKATFLHANSRHHSIALIESDKNGAHHLMVETNSLDDVGRAYDSILETPDKIAVTLGRHINDRVTSFYSWCPSGFMLEVGWGGRDVDDATWKPELVTLGPSLRGHERLWLPEEKRAEARALRKKAAAQGVRAPLHVRPGEFLPARDGT